MCLMVYLGMDRPFPELPPLVPETFGIARCQQMIPTALHSKAVVYEVREWGGEGWWCACDLHINQIHLETEPPDETTTKAYAFLQSVVDEALALNAAPVLFSCWAGDQREAVRIRREISVEGLTPSACIFDDIEASGDVGPFPSVFAIKDR